MPPVDDSLLDLGRLLPLAQGELNEEQTRELTALKHQIQRQAGFCFAGYKENCFRRRLAVRMRACGVQRYNDYAALLETNQAEYQHLLRTVTINVSRFYRNPDVWEVVAARVLPQLVALRTPTVNVWSAATAAGEEAHTLAILIREFAAGQPKVNPNRFRIIGTDIDPDALAAARRATYGEPAVVDMPQHLLRTWFEPGPPYRPIEEIRNAVRFWKMDLIADHFPRAQHLIVCRNVIMYFERELQERIFHRLHEALAPGGYLVLGKVESVVGEAASGFESVSPTSRVYRRI